MKYVKTEADIRVTLNAYTHTEIDNVRKEVESLKKAVL